MGQGGGEVPLFEGEFVSPVGGIQPGAAVVQDDSAGKGRFQLQPESEAERIRAAETGDPGELVLLVLVCRQPCPEAEPAGRRSQTDIIQ